MRQRAPNQLALLYSDYIRDVAAPGVEKTPENLLANRFPVFARCDRKEGLVFRYMRDWIERGSERAGLPLTERRRRAFDILDEVLSSGELAVSVRLDAGDILWINNRTLAHTRTGYVDTPGNLRQMQRMWVKRPA